MALWGLLECLNDNNQGQKYQKRWISWYSSRLLLIEECAGSSQIELLVDRVPNTLTYRLLAIGTHRKMDLKYHLASNISCLAWSCIYQLGNQIWRLLLDKISLGLGEYHKESRRNLYLLRRDWYHVLWAMRMSQVCLL